MKSHGGNYTSPAELRQRGVLTNLHKIVCVYLAKTTLDDLLSRTTCDIIYYVYLYLLRGRHV